MHLMLSKRSLRLSSILFILFPLFCSSAVIPTILFSNSLNRSSVSINLLLVQSRVFFFRVVLISVIDLFISVCLIFISSMSFVIVLITLIASWIFSILFLRLQDIFTATILNSFSGSFLISSLFTWSCVFLVCYFICAILLCLFIKKKNCVWDLLVSVFEVAFHLLFGFCSGWVGLIQWFVQTFIGCDLCLCLCLCSGGRRYIFFFFFCLWWSGLYEVVILLADDLVVFLFYLLLG